jgi:DNA repair protein RadC
MSQPSFLSLPSDADKQITKKLKLAGDQLGNKVLDHLKQPVTILVL